MTLPQAPGVLAMRYSHTNCQCEPVIDDNGVVRVKAACPQCGAERVGNAEEILRWRAEHQCTTAEKKS